MNPEELAAIKFRWEDTMEPDHGCAIERVKREPFECGVCARKRRESAADVPALVEEVERLRRVEAALRSERPEWIVNDGAELGVMVHGRAFFLYKGGSLEYRDATHDDGTPMMYRSVGKREFGECCHPVGVKSTASRYLTPLQTWKFVDGVPRVVDLPNGGWAPLPKLDASPVQGGAKR